MKIYRDQDGDLWSVDQHERVFLAVRPAFVWEGPTQRTWERLLDDEEGPLTELEAWESAEHMPGLLELIERLPAWPCPNPDDPTGCYCPGDGPCRAGDVPVSSPSA